MLYNKCIIHDKGSCKIDALVLEKLQHRINIILILLKVQHVNDSYFDIFPQFLRMALAPAFAFVLQKIENYRFCVFK